jgi:hypothetical protein
MTTTYTSVDESTKHHYIDQLSAVTSEASQRVQKERHEKLDKFVEYIIEYINDEKSRIGQLILTTGKSGENSCHIKSSDIDNAYIDLFCDPEECGCSRFFWWLCIPNQSKQFKLAIRAGFKDTTGYCLDKLNKEFNSKGMSFQFKYDSRESEYIIKWT